MNSLTDIKKSLSEERPVAWDALPDIDLYMDQVLSYMRRQLLSTCAESTVTAAMVNNYIRDGVLPRTSGKKYSRGHIAKLTTICILKQVLSVGDISVLFQLLPSDNIRQIYEKYRQTLDNELTSVMENVPDKGDEQILADAIMRFAIISYANKVAAEQIIDMIKKHTTEEKEKVKEAKAKAK